MYILSNFTCCFCNFLFFLQNYTTAKATRLFFKKKKKSVFFFFFPSEIFFLYRITQIFEKVLEKVEEKCLYSALFWLVDCIFEILRLPTLVIR